MAKSILKMNKKELLCYLKENPNNFQELYTKNNISKINWDYIPKELIIKNGSILKYLDWYKISGISGLSECFIDKHKDWVRWYCILECQKLSENFISKHENYVIHYWTHISLYQKLSETFISKYKNYVNWHYISEYQKLSENFVSKHKDLVDWYRISAHQKLSETFISKYKDLVDWYCISKYQKLSEGFIAEHKDLVNWYNISEYQKLSKKFISKYKNYLIMFSVNDNWLNKSTKFKKKEVVDTGKYECHEDYFIAYKGIRSDRYSKYNFQYQYMPGETYECFSDGSNDKASFGLSVWTKEKATEYCDELVVRCKIYYEDVTRVVHDDNKIRCSKITILD